MHYEGSHWRRVGSNIFPGKVITEFLASCKVLDVLQVGTYAVGVGYTSELNFLYTGTEVIEILPNPTLTKYYPMTIFEQKGVQDFYLGLSGHWKLWNISRNLEISIFFNDSGLNAQIFRVNGSYGVCSTSIPSLKRGLYNVYVRFKFLGSLFDTMKLIFEVYSRPVVHQISPSMASSLGTFPLIFRGIFPMNHLQYLLTVGYTDIEISVNPILPFTLIQVIYFMSI